MTESLDKLDSIYRRRFREAGEYRALVWGVLTRHFFDRFVEPDAVVLDLGCGYGEFINSIRCGRKLAMDANPDSPGQLAPDVLHLCQDCSERWQVDDASLDVVFTSNFFEHLPDKAALERTLGEARRCLKESGTLIALGPNIKFLGGQYWDFWDHFIPLTEESLAEVLELCGFEVHTSIPRFLPFTMSDGRRYPGWIIRLYLKLPMVWRFFGKQFLVVAGKGGS